MTLPALMVAADAVQRPPFLPVDLKPTGSGRF